MLNYFNNSKCIVDTVIRNTRQIEMKTKKGKQYNWGGKKDSWREGDRERSRFVKIKNIKKRNLLYGCFKKQSTQKISNQKMKSKERDKSILEYVQCMYNNVHAFKVPGFWLELLC